MDPTLSVFVVGMPLAGQIFFMLTTMLISIPTGVKVFNWTATLWRGSLSFEPPMLFALAFVILFSIGGFVYGVAQLLFVYVIWRCARVRAPVGNRPWEGARGLEWELGSPPPHHSWATPPPAHVVARAAEH